ncbi:MAG: YceD family protein [Ottowia sp.]|uniref:YceD family protein n=1 Tax=unclassified Ottowia TaxID=2645081 RepID=UPI003C2C23F3
MSRTFTPERLDVAEFSQAKAQLSGHDSLQKYGRLEKELRASPADLSIDWQAEGERLRAADGAMRPALHLHARADLPLTCQLCMGETMEPVEIDRYFVFVADEEAAAALDDISEDDVLVLSSEFNLRALIEDELLMALPLVPRHDECPEAPPLSAQDADFDAAMEDKPNPFAALASLKTGKKQS